MLIAFSLLLVATGDIFNSLSLRQKRIDEVSRDSVQLARIAELDVVHILESAHQLLATLARLPTGYGWDARACAAVEATASNDFEFDHINAVNLSGTIECSSSGTGRIGEPIVDRALFDRIAATGDFAVGSFGQGVVSGNPVLRIGHPVVDEAGSVIGVIYAGINLTWLNTAISRWQLGKQASIVITDRTGIVVAEFPNSHDVGAAVTDSLKPFLSATQIGEAEVKGTAGTVLLYGYIPVALGPSDGLGVFVGRDKVSILSAINRSAWINGIVVLVALFLSGLCALIYVRRFLSRPFQNLLTAAGRWRAGDWSARSGASCGIPEFDRVAWAFDSMAAAVQDRDKSLHQRDALLHAVAMSASEIITNPSLEDAIAKVLKMVGTTLQIDRVTVLDRPPLPEGAPTLQFAWQALNLTVTLDNNFFQNSALMTPQIVAWQAPLWDGKIIRADLRTAVGDLKRMLESLGTKSLLVLPVFIDGKYWGQIGFECCKSARDWPAFEIEKLQLLSDLIGTAIQRERYLKEIANADRIVQSTPTILYRIHGEPSLPMTYISQNIKLFGHDPAILIASPRLYLSLIHPDDVDAVHDAMVRALEGHAGIIQFRMLTGHGDFRWVENRYAPVCNSAGRLMEIEGLIIDITERKAAEEKISLLARTDPLTSLPNRATFIERLGLSFSAARRGATAFAVLYLDLDRFKDINDALGHPVGDRLLISVGERLKGVIRAIDIAARLGGDEFAVLETDLGDNADAGELGDQNSRGAGRTVSDCRQRAANYRQHRHIHLFPETAAPEDMLAQADVALYRAKEEGRDQYRFHTEELDQQVSERFAIAAELKQAIEHKQFELYYQPQVELDSGRIVGMEALIRWNHPTRGVIAPNVFIPIAETTGTMAAIGQWVLDRACRQMSFWRKSGIAPPILAINVSLVQLKNEHNFVELVCETLAKWELAPTDLEIDVTESMLVHFALARQNVLERLQKLGVTIAIDDFGTKYSSLDYLRSYHVSRLKIPKPMINSATHDPNSAAMVRAIVGIARELNIEVVAQGVETIEQWSFLTTTSPVTKVQGYYYSEPVPAERAEALLQRGRLGPAALLESPLAAKRRELAL